MHELDPLHAITLLSLFLIIAILCFVLKRTKHLLSLYSSILINRDYTTNSVLDTNLNTEESRLTEQIFNISFKIDQTLSNVNNDKEKKYELIILKDKLKRCKHILNEKYYSDDQVRLKINEIQEFNK